MTSPKLKLALGLGAVILLAGGIAALVHSVRVSAAARLTTAEIFSNAQARYAALTSYRDDGRTVATLKDKTFTTTFSIRLARPDSYRIAWAQGVNSSYTNTGVVWSAGDGDFLVMGDGQPEKQISREMALGGATGISGGAAANIPGTFFKMNWGGQLFGAGADRTRQSDEPVGDVDCYVLTHDLGGLTSTLWIGKTDFLIHQIRNVTSSQAMRDSLAEVAKRHPASAAAQTKLPLTDSISTETHEHILVDEKIAPADFSR